jgi:hypothetical protein
VHILRADRALVGGAVSQPLQLVCPSSSKLYLLQVLAAGSMMYIAGQTLCPCVQAYVSLLVAHDGLEQLEAALLTTRLGLANVKHKPAGLYQQLAVHTWTSYRQLLDWRCKHILARARALQAMRRDISQLLPSTLQSTNAAIVSSGPLQQTLPLDVPVAAILRQAPVADLSGTQALLLSGLTRKTLSIIRAAANELARAACSTLASVVQTAKLSRDTVWREQLDVSQRWSHDASMLEGPLLAVLAWCEAICICLVLHGLRGQLQELCSDHGVARKERL